MNYLLRYRQAIEVLDRPLTSEDGLPDRDIVMGEQRLGVRLPRALREYYGIAGRLDLNRAHNQLYTPHEWFVDAGKFVFMEENQEVVYWGIPISEEVGDDPPVSQGVNVVDQPIDWHPEHGRLFRISSRHAPLASGLWRDEVHRFRGHLPQGANPDQGNVVFVRGGERTLGFCER
jgi:hypothetical protein